MSAFDDPIFSRLRREPPTPEEAQALIDKWRAANPEIAKFWEMMRFDAASLPPFFAPNISPTGRRASQGPEFQDFPETGRKKVDETKSITTADFSEWEARLLAYVTADLDYDSWVQRYLLNGEAFSYATYEDLKDPTKWGDADRWPEGSIGMIGETYVFGGVDWDQRMQGFRDAGIKVVIVDDGIHMDFESRGGMIGPIGGPMSSGKTGARILHDWFKDPEPSLPDDEPSWEKLRDRRHGRRKHRGKGKRK